MATFKYSGRDKDGRFITGTRESDNRNSLIDEFRRLEVIPVSIEEVKSRPKKTKSVPFRLNDRETAFFTRQLSTLLNSGVPLAKALNLLAGQAVSPKIRTMISDINAEVAGGNYFWQALSKYPALFSQLYVGMIKAGESSGNLEKVLADLTDFMEQKEEIKAAITSMLIYPAILLVVGISTVVLLMTFVIPKMLFVLSDIDQPLPVITVILISVSGFLSKYLWAIVILCAAVCLTAIRIYSWGKTRFLVEKFVYKMPFIGMTLQKMNFARFSRILGLVLSNGISMLDALAIARDVVRNETAAEGLDKVRREVAGGSPFSVSLRHAGIFPPAMADMVSVGEETGRMEEILFKIAQVYDKETREEIRRYLIVLEPAIIFILALFVAFLVMAVLLPIFNMNLEVL